MVTSKIHTFCRTVSENIFWNTVFTWKNTYAQKSAPLKLAPFPFDVKYLMSTSLKWAPFFSLKRSTHLKNSI